MVLEPLRNHPLFAQLSDEGLTFLTRHATRTKFRAGRKVLREGREAKDVFVLVSGGVRIFHRAPASNEGEIVVKLFGAPAFFGEMEVLMHIDWLETVETVLPSEVIRIRGDAFHSILNKEHKLAVALVKDLTRRLIIATEHARVLAFSNAESRLASLMMDHVDLFGLETDAGVKLDVKISQESLARSLAVSRKTINETLGHWRDQKILSKDSGRYTIHDVPALDALRLESQYGLGYQSSS